LLTGIELDYLKADRRVRPLSAFKSRSDSHSSWPLLADCVSSKWCP